MVGVEVSSQHGSGRRLARARRRDLDGHPRHPGPPGQAAVLGLQRKVGNAAVFRLLQRQATAPPASAGPTVIDSKRDKDVVVVRAPNGTRYRVTRILDPSKKKVEPLVTGGSASRDGETLRVSYSMCKGDTEGEVELTINPDGALGQALNRIKTRGQQGDVGLDVVEQEIGAAELKSLLEAKVANSTLGQLSAGGEVTVSWDGYVGSKASVGVSSGPVEVKGTVEDKAGEDPNFGFTFSFTPGKRNTPVSCPEVTLPGLRIERWDEGSIELDGLTTTRRDRETRYLYFKWDSTELEVTGAAAKANKATLEALRKELVDDPPYRVTSLRTFTSPEGRIAYNEKLAKRRAVAAEQLLRGLVKSHNLLSLRGPLIDPKTVLPEGVAAAAPEPELHGGGEADLRGRKLHEEVIRAFGEDPREAPRHAEALEELEGVRGRRAKAQLLYSWLRRAEIELARTVVERGAPISVPYSGWVTIERKLAPEDVMSVAIRELNLRRLEGLPLR